MLRLIRVSMIALFIIVFSLGAFVGSGIGWILVFLLGFWVGLKFIVPIVFGLLVAWLVCRMVWWG